MKNAHLRFAQAIFHQARKGGTSTRITAYADFYVADDDKAHLLSLVGSDSVMAAFFAAISEGLPLSIRFPGNDDTVHFTLGDNPFTSRASIAVQGRKQPLRHIVAVSEDLHLNNPDTGIIVLNRRDDLAFSLLMSKLGLPARPEWACYVMTRLRKEGYVARLNGFNCDPIRVNTNREQLLDWIGEGVKVGDLYFPEENGPIEWPDYSIGQILCDRTAAGEEETEEAA